MSAGPREQTTEPARKWLCRVCQTPCSADSPFCQDCFALLECCPGCDCPKERCDDYGYGRKCCPDCKHRRVSGWSVVGGEPK